MGKETGFNRKNMQATSKKRIKKHIEAAAIGNATAQRERMAKHKADRAGNSMSDASSSSSSSSSAAAAAASGAASGGARVRSKSRSKNAAFKEQKNATAAATPKKENPKHIKLKRISKKKARRVLTQIKIATNEKEKAETIRQTQEAAMKMEAAAIDSVVAQFASMAKK